MATITATATGGNWTVAGTWTGGVVPTAADDVRLIASSGAVTINAAAFCRSLDCATYTSTLTHAATTTLTIGDATVGAGNNALRFVAGMTYTKINVATSAMTFVSTSLTTQTITTGGQILGDVTFNPASNGSWSLADSFSATNGTLTLTAGTLDTNSHNIVAIMFLSNNSNVRTLTLGASILTFNTYFNCGPATNMTYTANTATVRMVTAGFLALGSANTNGTSFVLTNMDYSCVIQHTGAVIANLSCTGPGRTELMVSNSNLIITGALTLTGSSASNHIVLLSAVLGVAATLTAATVSLTNMDFLDITVAGPGAPFTGVSLGDIAGNSNIIFTPAVTRYAVTSSQDWYSTATWSASSGGAAGASVPLMQDIARFDTGSAPGNYSIAVERIGSIDCSGFTGTLSYDNKTVSLYGSVTLSAGMTLVADRTAIDPELLILGRGTHTFTSGGCAIPSTIRVSTIGGTYSLTDALTTSLQAPSSNNVILHSGTFNTNNFALTVGGSLTVNSVAVANFGSSIIILTPASFTPSFADYGSSNMSLCTFVFSGIGASPREFHGNAKTYGTLTYTAAGSTGSLRLYGSNTFDTINFTDTTNARTLYFEDGKTTTITTNFNVNGTAGKLMTLAPINNTASSLRKTGAAVNCDYLNIIKSSTFSGTWYANSHCVNGGGNNGWIFLSGALGTGNFFEFFD